MILVWIGSLLGRAFYKLAIVELKFNALRVHVLYPKVHAKC
jgi:hypothetical protein